MEPWAQGRVFLINVNTENQHSLFNSRNRLLNSGLRGEIVCRFTLHARVWLEQVIQKESSVAVSQPCSLWVFDFCKKKEKRKKGKPYNSISLQSSATDSFEGMLRSFPLSPVFGMPTEMKAGVETQLCHVPLSSEARMTNSNLYRLSGGKKNHLFSTAKQSLIPRNKY